MQKTLYYRGQIVDSGTECLIRHFKTTVGSNNRAHENQFGLTRSKAWIYKREERQLNALETGYNAICMHGSISSAAKGVDCFVYLLFIFMKSDALKVNQTQTFNLS